MKATDITKPTALFLTKIVVAVAVLCAMAQCNNANHTAEVQKESIVEDEPFAHENKVLQWYFNKIEFNPKEDTRYFILVSDRICVGCGSVVIDEMSKKGMDSTEMIITSKLDRKYPFLKENPKIFVDNNDVINTLNWDYPGITDITFADGKIVDIKEHVLISDDSE
ncbi:MAG: hypothetical protein J6V54_08220 [Bacteroidales bacterium]|nr:hypothetical protein [Bacteroidales bacterium]